MISYKQFDIFKKLGVGNYNRKKLVFEDLSFIEFTI